MRPREDSDINSIVMMERYQQDKISLLTEVRVYIRESYLLDELILRLEVCCIKLVRERESCWVVPKDASWPMHSCGDTAIKG